MERDFFTQADQEALAKDAKLAFLATLHEDGRPHLTLLTTLAAHGSKGLMFGQFCEGLSKENIRRDPRVAFLVMDMNRLVWRGRARWTHASRGGEDYEAYNRKPLFRYNSYFGVHTVHYFDLVSCRGPEPVEMSKLVAGAILSRAAGLVAARATPEALTHFSKGLFDKLDGLKFMSFVRADGWPEMAPIVAAASAGPGGLVVASTTLTDTPPAPGSRVAVFAMNLALESVMVRGVIGRFVGIGPLKVANIEIEAVYNSMPPKASFIWPKEPLRPVLFEDP